MADLEERKTLIAKLFGAAGKVPGEAVFEGYLEALRHMDTPKLFRVVERVLDGIRDLTDPTDYRPPSAGALWKASRAMRALPPPLELKGAQPKFLDFDTNANQLLLAYFWGKRAEGLMERYAPDCPSKSGEPGNRTVARTAIMVKWKDAWARDMREDREFYDGKLDGKQSWVDCMAAAERELDQVIATERVAA